MQTATLIIGCSLHCKVTFAVKSPPKKKGPQMKKLQVHKLHDPRVRSNLQVMLEKRLHCETAAEPEEQWKQMKTILQETTAEVVGLSTRKHRDWFDEADKEFQEQLEKKRSCHNHLLAKPDDQAAKAAYKTACSTRQAKLRTTQNAWWTGLAERTQRYADMGDMRAFYEALKAVYGPSHQIQAPLCSSDGSTLLTDKEVILQHWSEHFKGLFSDQHTVQESSLAKSPQVDVKLDMDDTWH